MLRAISESLFDFLIDAFPAIKSYAREDFEQDPMPSLLAHFLTHTLNYRLDMEVEQLRSARTNWFDYEHEEVRRAYKQFVVSLANHAIIPEEEWRGTLKRATKVVVAHLILPAHTLVEFVFKDDDESLMAPVIYKQLSYFAAYPYLREAVETFMERRGMEKIDRSRFASLLAQIDRHMTADFKADDWIRLLRPLFDLMNRIPETRGQGVPIELLSMYFGDKDAYETKGRLQIEKEVRRVSNLNEESLRNVLEGSVQPFEQHASSTHVAPEPTPEQAAAESEEEQKEAEEPVPAPSEKAASTVKPLWQQFQHVGPVNGAGAAKETAQAAQPSVASADNPVPLWQRFQRPDQAVAPVRGEGDQRVAGSAPVERPQAPSAYSAALNDLAQLERQVLGPQGPTNRSLFIEHLFSGSSAEYAEMLHALRQMPDWARASQLIADRVFKRHQVNIYSPAALMFTESIEGQYRRSR